MAKASEQFRQSDVTRWGIVALVLGGLAVMAANISAVIPQTVLAGMHKTRLDGASLDQLRAQVTQLREETERLRENNDTLSARFALEEQEGNEVTRRVGALEVSLPRLLEALPDGTNVDLSSVTAAIETQPSMVYEAEGGTVMVRQQPMAELQGTQPLPEPVQQLAPLAQPSNVAYGVALGPAISTEQASSAWRDLSVKLGPLLLGMEPLLADEANSEQQRIVAGPIAQLSDATSLCTRLERISVSCLPTPYSGLPFAD